MSELSSALDGCSQRPVVPAPELHRLLGYPRGRTPDARVAGRVAEAQAWYRQNGRPWTSIRFLEIAEIQQETIRLNGGQSLHSSELASDLLRAQADQLAVVAVSAGPEARERIARLWAHDRPDESFVLDAYCSAVAEQLMARAGARISGQAETLGRICLPHRSPGYGSWTLSDQAVLAELLGENLGGPLEVLPSGMLRPEKSMLAVFGLTRRRDLDLRSSDAVPCSNCDWTPCDYRRTAFTGLDSPLSLTRTSSLHQEAVLPADRSFDYAFSRKALQRWAHQHLDLKQGNGGIQAVFLFHGTTCSNMGMPIRLRYEVQLVKSPEGYWIRSARCRPDEDDPGFEAMCSYLEDADGVIASLDEEHPLEGCQLDMVLRWNPQISPSGCLCKGSDRNHKWRIVLQTIHYTLGGADANVA